MVEKFEDLFDDGVTDLTSYRMGVYRERERIINLMNSHRCIVNAFSLVLTCNKCGDITWDKPSHLMRLIKEGAE